jgi:hypothetical protein
LLTRYHASGPAVHVIEVEADLDHEVGHSVARAVDGLITPQERTDQGGSLAALAFCSWWVSDDNTISVSRWQVAITQSLVTWDVVRIGTKLPWHVDL